MSNRKVPIEMQKMLLVNSVTVVDGKPLLLCRGCDDDFTARPDLLQFDHINPKGDTVRGNLQLLCPTCNRLKGNREMTHEDLRRIAKRKGVHVSERESPPAPAQERESLPASGMSAKAKQTASRKARGLCIECGSKERKPEPGRVQCWHCIEMGRARRAKRSA